MSQDEFRRIQRVKEVLAYAEKGMGIAGSVVVAFSRSEEREERGASRRILLGHPLETALKGTISSRRGAWALLWYIVAESKVNLAEASRRATKLSVNYERWAQLKKSRLMDLRILEMRGYIISAILGAVVSLLASLAPIISSFQITMTQTIPTTNDFSSLAIGFALVSSTLLGLYISPHRAYVNPAITVTVYAAVLLLAAPLTSFTLPSP